MTVSILTHHSLSMAERSAKRAARENLAQQQSSATTSATDEINGATTTLELIASANIMATIKRVCDAALARVPGSILTADDIASDIVLELATSKTGTETVQLLAQHSSVGMQRVRRIARQRVIDVARAEGLATRDVAIVRFSQSDGASETPFTGKDDRGKRATKNRDAAEQALVLAAISADADWQSADASRLRDYSGRVDMKGSRDAARDLGHEITGSWRNGLPKVRETGQQGATQSDPRYVRLLRGASLEAMLDERMRTHSHIDPSDASISLTGPLGRRFGSKRDGAVFISAFRDAVNDLALISPNAQVRNIPTVLGHRDAAAWRAIAVRAIAHRDTAESAAETAAEHLRTLPKTATAEQRADAKRQAKATATAATRANRVSQLAHHAANLALRGPVTLADLVTAAVIVETTGGEHTAEHEHSTVDLWAILSILGMSTAHNGRPRLGLGALLASAAACALDYRENRADRSAFLAYDTRCARAGSAV